MKDLWIYVNRQNADVKSKCRLFIGILVAICIAVGGSSWLVIGHLFLPGIEWVLAFMGYPAIFIGFVGGMIYLHNHEFTE